MIVFNEQAHIKEVCETVSWADEIVVVDSYSTDETAAIARQYTDKVFDHEFRGYKDKHEFADAQTTGDWIFWIDADERVTPELLAAIENLKKRPPEDLPDGFRIARRTWYLDRWIKNSGWYPDYQMRLYRKAASYWDGVSPHEIAHVKGRIEILPGELLHYTKKNLSESHHVADSYTTLAAEYHFKKGRTVGAFGLFFYPIMAFARTFLLKKGFLDGVPGLIIAMQTAYFVFLKYAKIWEHNNAKGGEPS